MSKKKVLLRGVFINRDTNGEGVLKVGTTLIRVSTVMGILYTGAGDSFWGGFMSQFVKSKLNPEDCSMEELKNCQGMEMQ